MVRKILANDLKRRLKNEVRDVFWAQSGRAPGQGATSLSQASTKMPEEIEKDEAGANVININDPSYGDDPAKWTAPEESSFNPGFRFYTSLAIFMTLQFLAAVDSTAIGNIMVTMSSDLKANMSSAEWIGNAYLLTSCAFQLPLSALSDIFGRRSMVYVTFLFFMLGSLICGLCKNVTTVIVGRTIQGVGAAGTLVLPEVFIADVVPLRLRGMYYAFLCGVWAVGAALGPVMAGALAQYATWRWLFYINLPVAGVAICLTPFGLRLKPISATWRAQLKQIDYAGAVIVIASATSVILAMAMGGSMYPWKSWRVIVPLILGVAGFVAAGFYEVKYPPVPIFNPRVFANRSAIFSFVQNTLQGIIALATLYYLPVYFQGVLGYGQLISGVALLPLNLVAPPMSLIGGMIITVTGHYHFITFISWILATFGCGILLLFGLEVSIPKLIFLQVPASLGIGALYASLSTAVIATNSPPEWTSAAAFMSFSRSLGDVFGTAIAGSVFASQMSSRLANIKGANVDSSEALTLASYIQHLPHGSLRDELRQALTDSVHTIFIVMIVMSALGLVLCFFIKEYSLDREYTAVQGIDDSD